MELRGRKFHHHHHFTPYCMQKQIFCIKYVPLWYSSRFQEELEMVYSSHL